MPKGRRNQTPIGDDLPGGQRKRLSHELHAMQIKLLLMVSGIFLAESGLRAGWRLLIFLTVLISCLLGFREVLVHIPTLTRMVQPLREGRLVVSAALIAEFQFVLSLLIAVSVMSRIERRSLADYGLPTRDSFGRYFWQGVVWGLLAVTCVMMLIFSGGAFSFGNLALY